MENIQWNQEKIGKFLIFAPQTTNTKKKTVMSPEMQEFKKKSFWEKPEGATGKLFLGALIVGGGYLFLQILPALLAGAYTMLQLTLVVAALGAIVYVALDPKARALIGYGYKSIMRWITGMFVTIDPIGILKNYISDLKGNLRKMNTQIGKLRGQMHQLKEMIKKNEREIKSNLSMANRAKNTNKKSIMVLKARKAGRLKDSNMRLDELYTKMEVLYRVLGKMYENSEIMLEDIEDQVKVKEQERKAIRASHSAMRSARNIISGQGDKREMFDMALDAIADDVSQKVGEMERFMDMTSNFMDSVDLQNGVFEEEGLELLQKWEKESESLILGDDKSKILNQANNDADVLDLDSPIQVEREAGQGNQYDSLFD